MDQRAGEIFVVSLRYIEPIMTSRRVFCRLVACVLCVLAPVLATAQSQPSVAFYYGNDVPVDMLNQFDWTVVEADHVAPDQLEDLQQYGTTAFAYVSLGEADGWRADGNAPNNALKADNPHWNSRAADLTDPAWRDYVVNQRIRPLWQQGYRGFFLDTLDSYRLFAKNDEDAAAQQAALAALITRIHDSFPGIKLLLNRGFEVLDRVHDDIVGVAAESLYKGWNQAGGFYRDVGDENSNYVLNRLTRVRTQYGLPAIAIDYVDPAKRDEARATAHRIMDAGLIPWVSDATLDQVGVGAIEPMPRKVLLFYDKSATESGELAFSNAHRYAALPLEYMGYGVVYQDVNAPLPTDTLTGRYAGVVSWFDGRVNDSGDYRRWLLTQMKHGVRVAMLGDPGISISGELGRRMGVQTVSDVVDKGLEILGHDSLIGFEGVPDVPPPDDAGYKVVDESNTAHLRLRDGEGTRFAPVVTGDWGGVALSPWLIQQATADQGRWILDPFVFLEKSLDPPDMPVPDATTENGSRYWMTQIDGDAFVSRAQFPGSPFNGDVLLREILQRYRVPTTVSVIEGELAPYGLYPELTDQVEPIARKIFRLPWVEIGTHTYSHPFDWVHLQEGDLAGEGETAAGFHYNLPIKGYHFSLEHEVAGSTDYINSNLAPAGKKVSIILWSGDALPPRKAIAIADRLGLANMNGGSTHATEDNPSLTDVSAMLRPLDEALQVYAPQINENVYTHDMTSPLWGYRRVIETYKITDTPRRLKPIDMYYHFYSASNPASLRALKQVYAYVRTQHTLPLYASRYSDIARNWYHVGIARRLDGGWQITGATDMRTLRLPANLGWPDMAASRGVAGVRDLAQGRYVALSGRDRVQLQLGTARPAHVYLRRSNGRIVRWRNTTDGAVFTVRSEAVPLEIELGHASGCDISASGARRSGGGNGVLLRYSGTDSGSVRVDCGS